MLISIKIKILLKNIQKRNFAWLVDSSNFLAETYNAVINNLDIWRIANAGLEIF